jgi:hypothetical protein
VSDVLSQDSWRGDHDVLAATAEMRRILKAMRLPLSVTQYGWWKFELAWSGREPGALRFDLSCEPLHAFQARLEEWLPHHLPEHVLYASRPRPRLGAGTVGYARTRR